MKKRSKPTSSYSGSEEFSGNSNRLYQFSSSRASTYTERSNYTTGSVQADKHKSSGKDKSFPRSLTVVFSSCFLPRRGNTEGDDDDAMANDVSFASSKFNFCFSLLISGIMLCMVVIGNLYTLMLIGNEQRLLGSLVHVWVFLLID